VIDPVFASTTSDQITGYTVAATRRCGPGTIWPRRLFVTGDSVCRRVGECTEAIADWKSLVDVTGNNLLVDALCRSIRHTLPDIQKAEASNGIYKNGPWFWLGNVSRDQFAGRCSAYVAYDMIDRSGDQGFDQRLADSCHRISARARLEIARTRWPAPTWTSSRARLYKTPF